MLTNTVTETTRQYTRYVLLEIAVGVKQLNGVWKLITEIILRKEMHRIKFV
jgi:hypothetical protein